VLFDGNDVKIFESNDTRKIDNED